MGAEGGTGESFGDLDLLLLLSRHYASGTPLRTSAAVEMGRLMGPDALRSALELAADPAAKPLLGSYRTPWERTSADPGAFDWTQLERDVPGATGLPD